MPHLEDRSPDRCPFLWWSALKDPGDFLLLASPTFSHHRLWWGIVSYRRNAREYRCIGIGIDTLPCRTIPIVETISRQSLPLIQLCLPHGCAGRSLSYLHIVNRIANILYALASSFNSSHHSRRNAKGPNFLETYNYSILINAG